MADKYTDDDIRSAKKVTTEMAAAYLGMSKMAVCCGMRPRDDGTCKLPIGTAVFHTYNWTYHICPERLIAYKNGRLIDSDVARIERKMAELMTSMTELQKDLKVRKAR